MGLLDTNYQDQRLTASQKKKIKPAIQGGGYNYLGEQEEVTVPRKWLSDPDHVVAELAYITPREKKVLIDLNMYGSLDGKPNNAPGGLPSLQGDMGSIGGGGNTGNGGGEGNRMSYATGGQYGSGKSTEGEGNAVGQRQKEKKEAEEKAARAREKARIQSQIDAQKRAAQKKAAQEKKAADERAARLREEAAVKASRDKAAKEREIKGRDPSKQYEDITQLTDEQRKTLEEQRQQAQYAISPSTDPKNQTIKTLLNLGVFPGVGNLYSAYLDATALGYPLSASFPDFSDIFSGGDISQQMENIRSIQGGNGDDGGGGMGQISTPVAPVAPSNNLPPSMVNQYFANLNLGQALSSDLQTSYNNAKNTVNNLLGINPMSQQFGYSADPYGGLMASNLTTNPFNIDYLRRLGLI